MARSKQSQRRIASTSLIAFLLYSSSPTLVCALPAPRNNAVRSAPAAPFIPADGGIHLPLQRSVEQRRSPRNGFGHSKRQSKTASIALGDVIDVTYNVLVTFPARDGNPASTISTPLVLDTGSSDLWVLSSACRGSCTPDVSYLPTTSLAQSGITGTLLYGDSLTGTRASGPIGSTTVTVAGITLENQFLAAIENTNTSVLRTGSAGIFGLGFPINSVVFSEIFKSQFPPTNLRRDLPPPAIPVHNNENDGNDNERTSFPTLPHLLQNTSGPHGINNERTQFPQLPQLLQPIRRISKIPVRRQVPATAGGGTSGTIVDVLSAFSQFGPFVTRLLASNSLLAPVVTVSLQRNTLDIGGNQGLLSIGSLPSGVNQNNLHWVPVRSYSFDEGGLPAPPDSPNERYPIAWEFYIDEVIFNGVRVPRSNLTANPASTTRLRTSALVDSGNSLIRGPQDVVNFIYSQIAGSSGPASRGPVACNVAHNLTFVIDGIGYTVDPRDFLTQQATSDAGVPAADLSRSCMPNIVATDPPGIGFLYSWSLGDPFFKSNLISFYYGNITYPSVDPPRIGLLNTVPADASAQFTAAVDAATQTNGGTFPAISAAAPNGALDGPGGVRGVEGYGEVDVARFATAVQPVSTELALAGGGPGGSGVLTSGNGGNMGGNGQTSSAEPLRLSIGGSVVRWTAIWALGVVGGVWGVVM